jgi:hypothetical protein
LLFPSNLYIYASYRMNQYQRVKVKDLENVKFMKATFISIYKQFYPYLYINVFLVYNIFIINKYNGKRFPKQAIMQ